MIDAPHQFDRRKEDVNYAGLALRVGSLEGRITVLENEQKEIKSEIQKTKEEVQSNTRLTEQILDGVQVLIEGVAATRELWAWITKWFERFGRMSAAFRRWSYATAKYVAAISGAITATATALHALGLIDVSDLIRAWWAK